MSQPNNIAMIYKSSARNYESVMLHIRVIATRQELLVFPI